MSPRRKTVGAISHESPKAQSPALLATVAWQHDDSNYASFWRAVGRETPPNLGMSRFVMCMYSLAAELRMHLLAHAAAGIDQADALARLRRDEGKAAVTSSW